jgi:hypothetical protein
MPKKMCAEQLCPNMVERCISMGAVTAHRPAPSTKRLGCPLGGSQLKYPSESEPHGNRCKTCKSRPVDLETGSFAPFAYESERFQKTMLAGLGSNEHDKALAVPEAAGVSYPRRFPGCKGRIR